MRTIVIGAGRMGRRHIAVARQSGLDVVAVVDPDEASRSAARDEFALPAAALFTSAEQAISACDPECVIIATTAPSHCELTLLAIEHGARYVLCEKPMAVSLAECDRMIAAAERTGTALAINHQMRFMEQYTVPKSLLESEVMGGLTSVTVVAGNFGLAMNGTHYLEMFRFMTGESIARVTAWFSSEPVANPRGPQFEDRAGGLRGESVEGHRFYLDASADQGHGLAVVYGARYGQIVIDELAGEMRVTARLQEHRQMPTTRYGMPWLAELRQIAPADVLAPTRAVLDALLARANYPTGADGRHAVAALVAAYESAERGSCAVAVDASLPLTRSFPWA